MKKSGFKILLISSALIKAMGFIYKLPLANVLGKEMLGVYQLVFPTYSLLLTLTSSSFSSAIAGRFKELDGEVSHFSKILTVSGVVGTVILILLAFPLAYFMGEARVGLCFILVSPSIYFVARSVYYKGVSQGMLDFSPTAVSEILEQGIKIAISLPLLFVIKDKYLAMLSAVFAITCAEGISLIYLKNKVVVKNTSKRIGNVSDVMLHSLSFAVFPLCTTIESVISLKLLCSVSEYGIYYGVAIVISSIPVTVISALSTSILPKMSDVLTRKETLSKALFVTLAITIPFSFGMYCYKSEVLSILFPSLIEGKMLAEELLSLCFMIPICQGVQMITTASLYGIKNEKAALKALLIGGGTKIAILLLGGVLSFGIKTAPIAAISSFLLAAATNLVYIIREKMLDFSAKKTTAFMQYVVLVAITVLGIRTLVEGMASLVICTLLVGAELFALLLLTNIKPFKTSKGRENNVG